MWGLETQYYHFIIDDGNDLIDDFNEHQQSLLSAEVERSKQIMKDNGMEFLNHIDHRWRKIARCGERL